MVSSNFAAIPSASEPPKEQKHEVLCEWPCLPQALKPLIKETTETNDHMRFVRSTPEKENMLPEVSLSSIHRPTPPRQRASSSHVSPLFAERTIAKALDPSNVPKRQIDKLYATIPDAPFPRSSRWVYEQMKSANNVQAAAFKAAKLKAAAANPAPTEIAKSSAEVSELLHHKGTEIERKMRIVGTFSDEFIADFMHNLDYDSLRAKYSSGLMMGELDYFLAKHYANGIISEPQANVQTVASSNTQASTQPIAQSPTKSSSPAEAASTSQSKAPSTPQTQAAPASQTQAPSTSQTQAPSTPQTDSSSAKGSDDEDEDEDAEMQKILDELKDSDNWWDRNRAFRHIVETQFSEDFNLAWSARGEEYAIEILPEEGAKFRQLELDYRLGED